MNEEFNLPEYLEEVAKDMCSNYCKYYVNAAEMDDVDIEQLIEDRCNKCTMMGWYR